MDNRHVTLSRDVLVRLVPSGSPMQIPEGTAVTIVQSLGNTFTVNVFGNLARIDGHDADALGLPVKSLLDDLPPDASIRDKVSAQLETVFDPEIPVNVVELGLIYRCDIEQLEKEGSYYRVLVEMTLTAPGCGMGPVLVEEVRSKVQAIPEVAEVAVELVFDPPWDHSRMSDAAKLELGVY